MANLAYNTDIVTGRNGPNWSAVWAGTFAFVAIWSVFGLLGEAIFASAAAPRSANTVGAGIGWGMGIWSVVLTMIAMYVGGRVTGHFSRARSKHEATLAGLTMFGLSVASAVVLVALGGAVLTGGSGVTRAASSGPVIAALTDLGWAGFISLFLGWLCAMWGASSALSNEVQAVDVDRTQDNVRDIRAA